QSSWTYQATSCSLKGKLNGPSVKLKPPFDVVFCKKPLKFVKVYEPLMTGRKSLCERWRSYSPPNLKVWRPYVQLTLSCHWVTLIRRPCGKAVPIPKPNMFAARKLIRVGQAVGVLWLQPGTVPFSKNTFEREKLKRPWFTKLLVKVCAQSSAICWLWEGTSTAYPAAKSAVTPALALLKFCRWNRYRANTRSLSLACQSTRPVLSVSLEGCSRKRVTLPNSTGTVVVPLLTLIS